MSELEPERKINREDFSKFPNPKAGLHLQDPKQFVEALRLINQLPNPTKGGFKYHPVGEEAILVSVEMIDEVLGVLKGHNIPCEEVQVVRRSDLPLNDQRRYGK